MPPLAWNVSATDLVKQLAKGSIGAAEATDYYLARVERLNPAFNAITFVDHDGARQRAADLDRNRKKLLKSSPLFGLPIALKCLTPKEGWPFTHASSGLAHQRASISHAIVSLLESAGAVLFAQTSSPELGTVPVTESRLYGISRNPWDPERSPGGSSGGAGAAVCAGMTPVAEASDGGGSIRIPAAYCGLVGMKPSRGRIPPGPILADPGIVARGFVTRTVADTTMLLNLVVRQDPGAWLNAPDWGKNIPARSARAPRKLKFAVQVTSPLGGEVDPECATQTERLAEVLEELGHERVEARPAWAAPKDYMDAFMALWGVATLQIPEASVSALEPHNRWLRARAAGTSSLAFHESIITLQRMSRKLVSSWGEEFDLLLTPTTAEPAPRHGTVIDSRSESEADGEVVAARGFGLVPFTSWFNVTGQPAISLPVGRSHAGLPIGVQVIAGPWNDLLLLQVAQSIERHLDGWGEPSLPGISQID